ncbi:MAG: GPP34 family phosphoprotein [Verrucomicrobia bacterium]|nr:GPP34 family phosphoprotein [Verrucomicrobiota bacterium]
MEAHNWRHVCAFHTLWSLPQGLDYNRYPTDDSLIEDRIRMRIIDSLFGSREMDTRDYVLLTLIGASKLEKEVFAKDQVKEARKRIEELRVNDAIGSAITKAVKGFESMIAAILVTAVIIPTITSSS